MSTRGFKVRRDLLTDTEVNAGDADVAFQSTQLSRLREQRGRPHGGVAPDITVSAANGNPAQYVIEHVDLLLVVVPHGAVICRWIQ